MMKKLIAIVALVALSSSAHAAVNLVANGNFETGALGTQPPPSWIYSDAGWGTTNLKIGINDPTVGVWNAGLSPNGGHDASFSYGGNFDGDHWIYQVVP